MVRWDARFHRCHGIRYHALELRQQWSEAVPVSSDLIQTFFLRQYDGECGSRHVFPSFFCWLHDYEGEKRLSFQDVRSRKSMTDHAYHAENKPRLSNLRPRGIQQECENRIWYRCIQDEGPVIFQVSPKFSQPSLLHVLEEWLEDYLLSQESHLAASGFAIQGPHVGGCVFFQVSWNGRALVISHLKKVNGAKERLCHICPRFPRWDVQSTFPIAWGIFHELFCCGCAFYQA